MREIVFDAGTNVDRAARMLVAHAPACGDFNGVRMRAKYATTRAHDVVKQWQRTFDEHARLWRRSPDGQRYAREAEARVAEAQRTVDDCVATLERVGPGVFRAPRALLSWLDRMAPAADHVGAKYDHDGLVLLFATNGWAANANCDDKFDENDARNFAGWIVGQWLASRWPGVAIFIEQWRERFEHSGRVAAGG